MAKGKHLAKHAAKPETKSPSRNVQLTGVKTKTTEHGQEVGSILSGEQKKRLVKQRQKEKKASKVPRSAQQTISYQNMYKDGICQVTDHYYTKCMKAVDDFFNMLMGVLVEKLAEKEAE